MPAEKEELNRVLKAALIRRDAWDETPEFGVVYRSATGVLRLAPWGIEKKVWDAAGHPRRFLVYLAEKMSKESKERRDTILYGPLPDEAVPLGIYFRFEGYAPPDDQAEELHRRRKAGGSVPLFKDIPGRQEFRMAQVAMFDGAETAAVQFRETPLRPPEELSALDGGVTDALMTLTLALTPEE